MLFWIKSFNFGSNIQSKKMKLHFPIVIEQDEDNIFIASCPTFSGCHSYGKTIDEAMANIKEVIEMCLEEQEIESVNQFVGLRDIELEVA